MAFQFSHEFHRNWLAAPQAERTRIKQDLQAIVELLKPDTNLASWQKQHGIYEKNTVGAEQASLFDEPQSADMETQADTPVPTETNQLTSDFLKQVVSNGTSSDPDETQHFNTVTHTHMAAPVEDPEVISTSVANADIEQIALALRPDMEAYVDQAVEGMKAEILSWLETHLKKR